jgi:hypothetical protein
MTPRFFASLTAFKIVDIDHSVYILGIEDKKFLAETYGKQLGKASVSGYCIKFKKLKDINLEILQAAILHRPKVLCEAR